MPRTRSTSENGERHAPARRAPAAHAALPGRVARALEEYLFHLSLVRAVSARTVEAYGSDLTSLFRRLSELGVRDPEEVTATHLRDYLVYLGQVRGQRRASVARARSAIRSFYAFLTDERGSYWQGRPLDDPSAQLPAPRAWRTVPRALTEEEAEALIESVKGGGPLEVRDRALLEVAYGTGVRVSELLGFGLEDCLWEEELLRVTGKGARTRILPLGRPAARALRTYTEDVRPLLLAKRGRNRRRGPEPDTVFLNARGGPLSRMGFWKILRGRAQRAGLREGVHPHLLRHTYATHLLRAGASLRVVQELLGHARLATTQIYTSVDDQYLQGMHRTYHPRG